MLRIAHIDDKPDELTHHQALMAEYFALRPRLKGELIPFSSQEDLLAAAIRESFDLYLLDILMPGENGIQLGRRLREVDKRGAIIYLTSSPDFAVESYTTRAFYYLQTGRAAAAVPGIGRRSRVPRLLIRGIRGAPGPGRATSHL